MKNFLFIFFFCIGLNSAYGIETRIIHNIQNEIITNIDIKKEFKYLLALNNSLKDINKEKIFNISSNSIIREKIKKIEISKNFKEIKINDQYLELLLKNIYSRLKLNSLEEFEIYLKDYNLNLYDIKEKVESELKKIMQVPWIMALVSVLVLCVFYTGDVKMLVLSLYIVHYLAIHQ